MQTLKVKELIEQLSKFDPELPIIIGVSHEDSYFEALIQNKDIELVDMDQDDYYKNDDFHIRKYLSITGKLFDNEF